ncbi:hypothetical protein KIMH_00750 [Bombiscardovia apis]|uniref:Uncharacterized protein n=1 Tax=Bombiscardovia apis TaxID=2932182 RepID=A0ABN6SE71_9BIFI|nr:hypothetical protein KIMH_00750 [Bombiscardovia apis]
MDRANKIANSSAAARQTSRGSPALRPRRLDFPTVDQMLIPKPSLSMPMTAASLAQGPHTHAYGNTSIRR